MVVLQENIIVNRSLADCYRYLLDFSTVEQWDPGVASAKKLTPGPIKPGALFEVKLALGLASVPVKLPVDVPMEYELLSAEINQEIVLMGKADLFTAKDVISFTPISKWQTSISYRAELTFDQRFAKFESVMAPVLKQVGKAAVSGLKQALDVSSLSPTQSTVGKVAHSAVLPAAATFTKLGYDAMGDKSHSQFMDGKTVVITGATSGIGLAAACEFSRLGANLVLVGRNPAKLKQATKDIRDFSGMPAASVKSIEADLALMSQVRAASVALAKIGKIDVLVNNAGALFNDRELTEEGLERSMALNLVAPWLMVESLIDKIRDDQTHVINVSSGGMYLERLRLDDMSFKRGRYNGSRAYARAKRGLIDLTEYWAALHASSGAQFNAMHPGWASTPGVSNSLPAFDKALNKGLRTAAQGADTIVWLGSNRAVDGETGKFWFDRQPRAVSVLPNTQSSDAQVKALVEWLRAHAPVQLAETADVESPIKAA